MKTAFTKTLKLVVIILLLLPNTKALAALQVGCPVGKSDYMAFTGLIDISWSLQDTLFRDGIYTDMNAAVVNNPLAQAHSYFIAPFSKIGSRESVEYSVTTTAPARVEYSATSNIYVMMIAPGWPSGIPMLLTGHDVSDFCDNVVNAIP